MEREKLKGNIISKIAAINDDRILTEVYQLLQFESNDAFELTEEQKAAIEKGLADLSTGNSHTQEEIDAEFGKWLKNNLVVPLEIRFV